MPRLSIFFIVLFLMPLTLFANKNIPGMKGKLGATAGSGALDLSDLNLRLSSYGFPALPQWYFTLGGIYQLSDGRVLGEVEYIRYINNSAAMNNFIATAGGWCSWVNVGYALINLPFLQIYPIAGIGGGTLSVKVTEDFSAAGFLATWDTQAVLAAIALVMAVAESVELHLDDNYIVGLGTAGLMWLAAATGVW